MVRWNGQRLIGGFIAFLLGKGGSKGALLFALVAFSGQLVQCDRKKDYAVGNLEGGFSDVAISSFKAPQIARIQY